MTPAQRSKAEREAKASLERLIVGWAGALMSGDTSADTRHRAREAAAAARKALKAGTPAAEVVRQHLAPAFEVLA